MVKMFQEPNLILDSFKNGDRQAFELVYIEHFEKLCTYLLNYTQDREVIQDIVQDTFVKLWTDCRKITITSSLKSYLYKSVYHNYIDYYRSSQKKVTTLESYYHSALIRLSETDEDYQELQLKKLDACIAQLPPKCKEVFVATKLSGMKHKDVATLLRISLKTIEGHTRKAYGFIRNCIK